MKSSSHNSAPSDMDHSSQHSDFTESTGAGETVATGASAGAGGRGLTSAFKMPEGLSNILHDMGSAATDRMKRLFGDAEELFGDVGELVAGYPCALESGILRQGRMFITNRFVCFYCNHFGAEKKIRIPYKQIQAVTKENTAMVIPNAIQIVTARTAYMFRSFLQRDECFNIINSLWKNYKVIEASGGPLPPAHVSKAHTGPPREVIPVVPIKSVAKPLPPPPEEAAVPAAPVVKLITVPTQPVQVEVNYAPTGKLGVAYDILVTRGPRWHVVHADFTTLKEMYDEVVSTNAELITCPFPPVVRGVDNMKGFGKLTPEQSVERISMLNTFVRSVLSNYRYIMPVELRQEFAAFIKMPEPDLAVIEVQVPEPELTAAGGVVAREFITKALLAKEEAALMAQMAQLHPDKDPNLDPTVVFKKNSSDNLSKGGIIASAGGSGHDEHSVSSSSSEGEPKLFTSTTRSLGVSGKPIFETHIAMTLDQAEPYLIAYDFAAYRKLYEDLRVRGIGYDSVANDEALLRSNPYLAASKKAAEAEDFGDSSDDDETDSDAGTAASGNKGSSSTRGASASNASQHLSAAMVGQKLMGVTKDVGELGKKGIQKIGQAGQKLGQAGQNMGQMLQTMVTTGRPARHGSFSEIDIDIRLKYPFPKKFHYKKLSAKDLDERCAVLDRWMRCALECYFMFDAESKEVVDRFLGVDALDGADVKTIQLLNIVEKLNHKGPIGDRVALLAKLRGNNKTAGGNSNDDGEDGIDSSSDSTGSSASAYSAQAARMRRTSASANEAKYGLNDSSSTSTSTGVSSSMNGRGINSSSSGMGGVGVRPAASSVPPPKPPTSSSFSSNTTTSSTTMTGNSSNIGYAGGAGVRMVAEAGPASTTAASSTTATIATPALYTQQQQQQQSSRFSEPAAALATTNTTSGTSASDNSAVNNKRPADVIKPEELKSIRFEDAPPPPPTNGCCVIS